jgi:hypothetical protein
MKCPNCGKEADDEAGYCWNCNGELRPRVGAHNTPYPPREDMDGADRRLGHAADNSPAPVRSETAHSGVVGGWLLYLCINLTILSPIMMIVQFVAGLSGNGNMIEVLVLCLLTLGPAAYSIITGVRLWTVRRNAVRHAKGFFVVMACLNAILLAVVALTKSQNVSDYTMAIRSLVSVAIWLTYLSRSVRVASTYGLGATNTTEQPAKV